MSDRHSKSAFRFPGSRPFGETELERDLFRGRAEEAEELLYSVLGSNFTVLYAASGSGKTSLLEAAVMHDLRDRDYFPVIVRLNEPSRGPVELIRDSMVTAGKSWGIDVDVPDHKSDSLWDLLSHTDAWRRDSLLTPILIFDQFEELFNLEWPSRARREFIAQLGQIVRGFRPRSDDDDAVPEIDRPPAVGFVISIREDSLGDLEALANDIPQVFTNRVRLLPLTIRQAGVAVCEPAALADPRLRVTPFTFDRLALKLILDFVRTRQIRGEDVPTKSIAATQLQIICSHIEQRIVPTKDPDAEGIVRVGVTDLEGREGISRILQHFYRDRLAQFPGDLSRRIRKLCETGLITRGGRRLSLDEEVIHDEFGIDSKTLRQLVQLNLLRSEPRLGSVYYELAHDVLVEPILAHRRDVEQQRRAKRTRVLAAIGGTLAALLVGVVAWIAAPAPPVAVQAAPPINVSIVETPSAVDIEINAVIDAGMEERSAGAFTVSAPACGRPPCAATVVFAPSATGSFEETLEYRTDGEQTFQLRLSGEALPPMGPALEAEEFAPVFVGAASESIVSIANLEKAEMRLVDVGLAGGAAALGYDITDVPCATIAPASSCVVSVSFAPPADGGDGSSRARFVATVEYEGFAEELEATLEISATALPAPMVPFDETVLDFGEAFGPVAKSVELRNDNHEPLTITTSLMGDAFTLDDQCSPSLEPDEACALSVAFWPEEGVSSEGQLTIAYGTESGSIDAALALSGRGIPAPAIPIATPDMNDFKEVVIGSELGFTLQLVNPNDDPLEIALAIVGDEGVLSRPGDDGGGGEFQTGEGAVFTISSTDCPASLSRAPANAQPEETSDRCNVSVRFAPTTTSTVEADLVVEYGSDERGWLRGPVAHLTGRGVANVPFAVLDNSIEVGPNPVTVTVGAGAVWVSNLDGLEEQAFGGSVSRIDPRDLTVTEPITITSGSPDGIAVSGDTVWLVDTAGTLYRIDAAGPEIVIAQQQRIGSSTNKVAVGHGAVWVTDKVAPEPAADNAGVVYRVEPDDLTVTDTVLLPGRAFDIATGPDAVWITLPDDDLVVRLDPGAFGAEPQLAPVTAGDLAASGAYQPFAVGDRPIGVAVADDGKVWVANNGSNDVSVIDLLTGAVAQIPVGSAPDGVAIGEGSVWITNGEAGTVTRIDRSTYVAQEFAVGDLPDGIAVSEGTVWVANSGTNTVSVIQRTLDTSVFGFAGG